MIEIKITAETIARNLAGTTSDEQANFINLFCSSLKDNCSEYQFGLQLSYICDELTDRGKLLITELAEYIKIKEVPLNEVEETEKTTAQSQ